MQMMPSLKPRLNDWIQAIRPKTLAGGTAPVFLATAFAYAEGKMQIVPALIAWGFALLAQIAANLMNDLADAKRGADHSGRIGPERTVSSGRITPGEMKKAIRITVIVAFLLGCTLIPFAGPKLIFVGVASLLGAYLYSDGPFPLAYYGLGDLIDLIFFGFVATVGTYYVQTQSLSGPIWWVALGIGCVINNLLIANNARDLESDQLVNKKTIAVRFGRKFCFFLYRLSGLIGIMVGPILWMKYDFPLVVCLPLVLYPLLWQAQMHFLRARTREDWAKLFGYTVRFMALYALMLGVGLILTVHFPETFRGF